MESNRMYNGTVNSNLSRFQSNEQRESSLPQLRQSIAQSENIPRNSVTKRRKQSADLIQVQNQYSDPNKTSLKKQQKLVADLSSNLQRNDSAKSLVLIKQFYDEDNESLRRAHHLDIENGDLSENEEEKLAAEPCVTTSSSVGSEIGEDGNNTDHLVLMNENKNALVPINDEGFSGDDEINSSVAELKDESDIVPPSIEQSPIKRMELGGILVYDAYARIVGSERLLQYYAENPVQRINPYVLFTKEEVELTTKNYFSGMARERDFASDLDKQLYQRIPKFNIHRELKAPQYTISVPPLHNMLIFDSRFESGNLRKAAKVNNIEYNLWLENDLNTKGHTQWFYFKVVYKGEKTAKIQFNILNLAKTYSLYKAGMKPVVFSTKKFQEMSAKNPSSIDPFWANKYGWHRACENIKYVQNDIPRYCVDASKFATNLNNNKFLQDNNGHGEGVENYYTLSFEYKFEYLEDEVWFAHAVPYTYTDMQNQTSKLFQDPKNHSILRKEILANTLSGIAVPLLTITENVDSYQNYSEAISLQSELSPILRKSFKQKYQQCRKLLRQAEESKGKVQKLLEAAFEEEIKCFFESNQESFLAADKSFVDFGFRLTNHLRNHAHKKAIVITSRVHPGEPQASFMLEGILTTILADTPLARELRKHFVFRVVPMLNPDGVIHGNYRCSLLGCDLNRKWQTPNKFLHPTIFYAKQMIRFSHWERKVTFFCDLHGHSRKQNAFFYGCSYKNYEQEGRIKNAQLRIIPLLCCHKNPIFTFAGCSFRIEKAKEATGRVVVFREFNIMNSFTLECSFHGKVEEGRIKHLSLEDMGQIGSKLVEVLECYLPSEQTKLNSIGTKVLDIFYDEFIKFVPAYILKREEEKRQEEKVNGPQALDASPSNGILITNQQLQIKKKSNRKFMLKPVGGQITLPTKKQTGRQPEQAQPDHSDTDNFSQMICFNERKDHHELELNELETFISFQYKRKGGLENNGNESSSDDDLSHMFRKQNRLQSIKPVKKRRKVAKGNSAHIMERKAILGSVLATATVNPLLTAQTTQVKREKEAGPLVKIPHAVNIVPEPKSQLRVGSTPLYIISEKNKVNSLLSKASPNVNSPPMQIGLPEKSQSRVIERNQFELERMAIAQQEVSSDGEEGNGYVYKPRREEKQRFNELIVTRIQNRQGGFIIGQSLTQKINERKQQNNLSELRDRYKYSYLEQPNTELSEEEGGSQPDNKTSVSRPSKYQTSSDLKFSQTPDRIKKYQPIGGQSQLRRQIRPEFESQKQSHNNYPTTGHQSQVQFSPDEETKSTSLRRHINNQPQAQNRNYVFHQDVDPSNNLALYVMQRQNEFTQAQKLFMAGKGIRKQNIKSLASQIRQQGGKALLDQRVIDVQRKIIQNDREAMVGVGYSIQLRSTKGANIKNKGYSSNTHN